MKRQCSMLALLNLLILGVALYCTGCSPHVDVGSTSSTERLPVKDSRQARLALEQVLPILNRHGLLQDGINVTLSRSSDRQLHVAIKMIAPGKEGPSSLSFSEQQHVGTIDILLASRSDHIETVVPKLRSNSKDSWEPGLSQACLFVLDEFYASGYANDSFDIEARMIGNDIDEREFRTLQRFEVRLRLIPSRPDTDAYTEVKVERTRD